MVLVGTKQAIARSDSARKGPNAMACNNCWVDTCRIDKSNSVELQEAINSMFRWYQNATKCYVYLSDVSTREREASYQFSEHTWESAFRSSRNLTRVLRLFRLSTKMPIPTLDSLLSLLSCFSVVAAHRNSRLPTTLQTLSCTLAIQNR